MFKAPDNFILLAIVVVWLILLWKRSASDLKRKRELFVSSKMFSRIVNHKPTKRPVYKWLMICVAMILIALGLMRPLGGTEEIDVMGRGLDLVVALDVSKSMRATDIGGNSRLDVAKALLVRLMNGLRNDRVGLVAFAGETMVQCPLSNDKNAFLTFLERVDPSLLTKQGTNLSGAIETAIDRFDMTASQSKVIVLVSDGEDKNLDKIKKDIDEAKKKNIKIFTVGIGSKEGGYIPERQNIWGDIVYKRFHNKLVKTKLNDKVLKQIAKGTGARYFRASDITSARSVAKSLNGLKRVAITSGKREITSELYFIPVLLAFLLLLFEWMVSERIPYEREKDHWLKRI